MGHLILFLVGIPLLWKGADLLVEGGVGLARRLQVSSLAVGLTIVSMGTSAPELAVNSLAAYRGSTDLALGNILGSNVANTLLILGAASLVCELAVRRSTVRYEIPFSVVAALGVALLANDAFLSADGSAFLGRVDALVLLAAFVMFLAYVRHLSGDEEQTEGLPVPQSLWAAGLRVVVGIAALGLGGHWIVRGALELVTEFGLNETFIGFSVVAFGTSLPELATALAAAGRRQADIVIGNVVGSNIFNLLWILGVTALIRPIPIDATGNLNLGVVALSSLVLLVFLQRSLSFQRWHGVLLVSAYGGFLGYLALNA